MVNEGSGGAAIIPAGLGLVQDQQPCTNINKGTTPTKATDSWGGKSEGGAYAIVKSNSDLSARSHFSSGTTSSRFSSRSSKKWPRLAWLKGKKPKDIDGHDKEEGASEVMQGDKEVRFDYQTGNDDEEDDYFLVVSSLA